MHSDAYTRQRQREPSESFRRETTQNSGPAEGSGIPALDIQASSTATAQFRQPALRWRGAATKRLNTLPKRANLSMDGGVARRTGRAIAA
jgi:membrane-bound lytic murein transglycosylase